MPKIPNVTTLRRRDDSGQAAVSSYSSDGVTAGLDEGAKFLNDLHEKRVRNQASKAEADMMVFMEQQKTAFDHDDEYETIEERWNGSMTDEFGRIAGTIQDAEVREAFVQKYKPKIEGQRNFIRDLAWGKEVDQDRADIIEKAKAMQDAFAISEDPEIIAVGKSLFDNSKGFSKEEIAKSKDRFGVAALEARLSKIADTDPEQALNLLNDDLAIENLPEGKRAKLISQYQGKAVDALAMNVVDDYMARDLSVSAGMSEAEGIEDPKLRKAVEQRFNYEKRMEKTAEVESQTAIHEDWHARIGPKGDGSTIDDIPMDQWEIMSPAQRQNLEALQYNEPRVNSDPDVLIQLSGMALGAHASNDWSQYNQFITENSSKLSNADRVKFSALSLENQAKAMMPPEVKSGLTDVQKVSAVLGEEYDKKQASIILGNVGRWRMDQQEAGHNPTDKEVTEFIDRQLLDYDKHSTWGTDTPYYKLTEEQVLENLQGYKEDNPERYQTILDLFAARKDRPTNDEILMLMREDMTDADVVEWFHANYR